MPNFNYLLTISLIYAKINTYKRGDTNEKTCLVYQDGILCERTDVMESLFLDVMNGRDIEIGSGVVMFDRELSRSCNSQLNIGNSKSFYGRSLVMALQFISGESGGLCG